MIKVINAHFIQSCERFSQAPSILGAEIAILGRSNVGKSSLINALLNNKNLAKSSSTPGKTRLVNFFSAKWRVDSAESQNLNENNPRVSAHLESRPLRGAKNRNQGCRSATADFLLEADKRGSPPKSEKRQLLGTHLKKVGGSGAEGTALLRKKTRELNSQKSYSFAESSLDSANPQNLKSGLQETSHSLVLQCRFAESVRNDESILDSAISTQEANSSIVDEFLQLCELSDKDRTDSSSRKRSERNCEKSPQDAEFVEFAVRILDFPGFGYAKVSKIEKSSWDKHLSEFLKKRDSIKLYLHLIDSRHQNLEIDNEIFAFLNRFKRGDSAILQVFTKADKLSKNELSRLKNQNKLYHSINDKNSTEILRYAILKILYNVDF